MNTQFNTEPVDDREHTRTGLSADALRRAFLDNLFYLQGRPWEATTAHDRYMAAAYTIRDRTLERWVWTAQTYKTHAARTVCYFSAEFLLGPHLANHILNLGIVDAKVEAENISKVLYPNDEPAAGKELRLKQQYFFVTCSLQDMLRLHLKHNRGNIEGFQEKFVVQLNDTHPAIAVAELMRLLVDEHDVAWDRAWEITRNTFAFTNHSLLPEALETWPVEIIARLLPRHLEIIYELNQRFLDEVRMRYVLDQDQSRIARLSVIGDAGHQQVVRMANLATIGSFAVNGVAALHTDLLKSTVMKDFSQLWPDRFHNVTNGVTPRRFLRLANPDLAG
jgi:starch phosphorylase